MIPLHKQPPRVSQPTPTSVVCIVRYWYLTAGNPYFTLCKSYIMCIEFGKYQLCCCLWLWYDVSGDVHYWINGRFHIDVLHRDVTQGIDTFLLSTSARCLSGYISLLCRYQWSQSKLIEIASDVPQGATCVGISEVEGRVMQRRHNFSPSF